MSEKLSDAQVSVSTEKKIREGSKASLTIGLAECKTRVDFDQLCREIHSDEENPVFQLVSWENLPKRLAMVWNKMDVFELLDRSLKMNESAQEALYVWLSFSIELSGNADEIINQFKSEYIGNFDSDEDFAYYYIENLTDIPEGLDYLKTYIDYQKLGNALLTLEYKCIGDRYVFKK